MTKELSEILNLEGWKAMKELTDKLEELGVIINLEAIKDGFKIEVKKK